jgi:hypothetical protein
MPEVCVLFKHRSRTSSAKLARQEASVTTYGIAPCRDRSLRASVAISMHYSQNLRLVIRYQRNPEKFKGKGWPLALSSFPFPLFIDRRDQEFS